MKLDRPQSRTIIPRTIRWRLPASYALIALLVALSLGGVLIGTLAGYYHQQEIDYLNRNATAVRMSLTHMLETDTSDTELQAQINLFSFLSRTHIELLKSDNSVWLEANQLTSVIDIDEQQPGVRLVVRQLQGDELWVGLPPEEITPLANATTEIVREEGIFVETIETTTIDVIDDNIRLDFVASPAGVDNFTHALMTDENQVFVNYDTGLYGFGLTQDEDIIINSARSTQSIAIPLVDTQGDPLGTLRLSDGPAYGVEIVTSVAWGWIIASLVSITLAIIVGAVISRDVSRPLQILTDTTQQMAQGDLSVRTTLQRQDELGTLAYAFNHMATQIESTVSTLHHFVSDAAHEINTPITALRTNLELIQSDQSAEHNPVTLARAINQVIRLQDLTRDLLQLSRLESGVNHDDEQSVDMIALIRETVGFYASRADQANTELELSFPQQPVTYLAHDAHLRTALSNVIDNAIKFTPDGGRVSISLESSSHEIAIHVRDTGVGIPPDHLPYVFNRFHRASNVSAYAGSGLGLSIVQTIVDYYQGSLSIKNLELGTRVSIFLPYNSSKISL